MRPANSDEMADKLRVGIFFGGSSREREVSFAGGRTVYDNLDKDLFDAVPIFTDEFGNMCILNWEYIYRGTIRDFYPPVAFLPESENQFQIYSESIDASNRQRTEMLSNIGEVITPNQLSNYIDLAFLALHGEGGEDGNIQGLLEWYNIPYTGSGILPSSIGMDKAVQKDWMEGGFDIPRYITSSRSAWLKNPGEFYQKAKNDVGFPLVIKSANQGSSIGVTILKEDNETEFHKAVQNSFFEIKLTKEEWSNLNQVEYLRELSDIRSSLGFPLFVQDELVHHPEEALQRIQNLFQTQESVTLVAVRGEVEVIAEAFIAGKEFSCIVLEHKGEVVALPPTEIVKSADFFDYKSKYLPGRSRKVTPINIPEKHIQEIREACGKLFKHFRFNVYARIDGFFTKDGRILLNDPNTTSGMLPSSFFFHQAAEIGLNPSQFLTYLIETSLTQRIEKTPRFVRYRKKLQWLMDSISAKANQTETKKRVAVVMGGYSTERHISVESGRNIFEKLASSGKYSPVPVFLTGSTDNHKLYVLPINVMLKDNADDIRNKVEHYYRAPIIDTIIEETSDITGRYAGNNAILEPNEVSYDELSNICDLVFIALHGRPGEDGAIQQHLERLGLPYNGSGVASSQKTIDKFATNNLLRENGFLVADNLLVEEAEWAVNRSQIIQSVNKMGYPLIAKPSDEGCSSAVLKLRSEDELVAYAEATFRKTDVIDAPLREVLKVSEKDEFPQKPYFLIEKFIDRNNAEHFLEITGGMVTKMENGQRVYEVFEPSEALAEGEILSLEEKFLAGEGQNITPARFASEPNENARISAEVRSVLKRVAQTLDVEGYCRIDAFVRILKDGKVEVVIIEINSLPGMTPATCIYHQAAINGYKPFEFIDEILTFGEARLNRKPA